MSGHLPVPQAQGWRFNGGLTVVMFVSPSFSTSERNISSIYTVFNVKNIVVDICEVLCISGTSRPELFKRQSAESQA